MTYFAVVLSDQPKQLHKTEAKQYIIYNNTRIKQTVIIALKLMRDLEE